MLHFTTNQSKVAARPVCSKCGTPMWLTRIQPDKPGCARRTFECPRCQHQMISVIELENAA
jgi:DNA-directed RNA polymerase subunit RPC12/RpoP